MRQQCVPKSTENESPNNDEQVTQELGDSTISTWFLKGEPEIGYQRRHPNQFQLKGKKIHISIQDTKGSPSKRVLVTTKLLSLLSEVRLETLPSEVESN